MANKAYRKVITATLCSLLTVLLATTRITFANGAPVDIFLDYLPTQSNWGPQDAKGQAVVAVGEGEVELKVEGLPRLTDGHYSVWLESRAERKLYPVGNFNPGEDGAGSLHVLLDDLPYQEYRMLLISVEPEPDPSLDPDPRRSLAGMFPNPAVIHPSPPVTATAPAAVGLTGSAAAPEEPGALPAHLPVTGSSAPSPWAAAGALVLVGCTGYVFGPGRKGGHA